jgi:hypothetical protein
VNAPKRRPEKHRATHDAKHDAKHDTKRKDQGIARDTLGQEQPTDKKRAQQTSNTEVEANQPPGPGQREDGE